MLGREFDTFIHSRRQTFKRACESGKKSDFYRGKVMQATWYADTALPHILATIQSCLRPGREVVDFPENAF